MGIGRGWLVSDWLSTGGGRSQHYCGGMYCGLPPVAFWQHNANVFRVFLVKKHAAFK